jgi:hypothetical protein
MNNYARKAVALLLVCLVAGCASVQKVSLKPEAKQKIKHIALIEVPEQSRYAMYPGQAPGLAALYVFGALGGLLVGGIESGRIESATNRFTEAVLPYKPNVSSLMLEKLEIGLKQKGYEVTRIPEPPKSKDNNEYDFAKVQGEYDAILASNMTASYSAEKNGFGPRVVAIVNLIGKPANTPLFTDMYLFSSQKAGDAIHLVSDKKYSVADTDILHQNIPIAVDGMKDGASQIADRILQDL